MIKHIVLWKLKDDANGKSKTENARELKRQLENLNGKIPGLVSIELGISGIQAASDDNADVALYSVFENQAALDAYIAHPEHQKIIPFARSIVSERRVIDFMDDITQ